MVLGISFLRALTLVGWSGTLFGLVLCHMVIVVPYVLRLTLASLIGLDRNCENAAIALGASQFTVFWRVTFPLTLPGIAAGWVLAFITSFDDVTVTILIASPQVTTCRWRCSHA